MVTTSSLISDVILEKSKNQEMWTAYDISKEVQKRCLNLNLPVKRHLTIGQEIHTCSQSLSNYTRSVQNIDDHHVAFVYHPINSDPNNYTANKKAQTTLQNTSSAEPQKHALQTNPTVAIMANPNIVKNYSSTINSNKKLYTDSRGSISIPNKMVLFFFKKGDVVSITKKDKFLIIGPKTDKSISNYKVDRNGNIRITSSTLRKGLPGGQSNKYSVALIAGSISITKV